MEVTITSTHLLVVEAGKVRRFRGLDLVSASVGDSTYQVDPSAPILYSVFVDTEHFGRIELPLYSITNRPDLKSNQEGANTLLAELIPLIRQVCCNPTPVVLAGGILPYADLGAFPVTGASGTLYLAEDTDIAYYWDGAGYVALVTAWSSLIGVPASFNPSAHAPTHQQGGSDPIKLDDLATPDDNTDLNASVTRHGLLRKLSGNAGEALLGDGTWGSAGVSDHGALTGLGDDDHPQYKVQDDGNPAGVSPISSGPGVLPIELRRFVDSLAIKAQANTGSVQFNLVFSGLNKIFAGDALGDPVEVEFATTTMADAIVRALNTGKIDTSFLPDSIVGQLEYQGVWNGSTNTPAIPAASTSNQGHYYVTSVGVAAGHGYPNIPNVDYQVGDWLVSNGTSWDKIDNTDAVSSVFGRLGAVIAAASDYDASQVDNDSTVPGAFVDDALNNLQAEFANYAPLNHDHERIAFNVNQVAHGLSVGEFVFRDGGANVFTQAEATTEAKAEVAGYVDDVIDADNFTLLVHGRIRTLTGLTDGTVYFLDHVTPGGYTATPTTTSGEVKKALFVAIASDDAIFLNHTGQVNP